MLRSGQPRQVGWVDRAGGSVWFIGRVGHVCYFSENVDAFEMKHSSGMCFFGFCSVKSRIIKYFNTKQNILDPHFKTLFFRGE